MKKIVSIAVIIGAVLTLIGLSGWQVSRMMWKNNIVTKLDAEYEKTPQNYVYDANGLIKLGLEENPIRYGLVKGNFIYQDTMLFGPKPHEREMGYHVVTPLKIDDETDDGIILVNRGWISLANKDKAFIERDAPVSVIGIIRKSDWNDFTPNNSPENEVWSKLDTQEIASVKNYTRVAPVILYAKNTEDSFIIPQDGKWYPRNKHLEYAIFWLVMAISLLSVTAIYLKQNKK